jgi:hypothetical protein
MSRHAILERQFQKPGAVIGIGPGRQVTKVDVLHASTSRGMQRSTYVWRIMAPEIIAAIVGGLFAILAAVVAIIGPSLFNSGYQAVGARRSRILAGTWVGKACQDEGRDGGPISYNLTFNLNISWRVVKGRALVKYADRESRFRLEGGFLHGQFFRVEYSSTNSAAIEFGSIVLRLSADGQTLTGKFVGYGSSSDRLVGGTMNLAKTA